jgi:beta-phosphoglucomutase
MNTRAAALDLDGVILDGMPYHIAAWHEAFAPFNITLSDRQLYLLEGIKTRDVVDIVCDQVNLQLTSDERDEVATTKKRVYRAIFRPTPLAGADEFLRTMNRHGYRIAIVTGTTSHAAEATLAEMSMRNCVELIISSELNIPGKPDPAPFLEAIQQLGVQKEHCLAVDNAPAGVSSAVGAGLPCVAVATYLPKSDLTEARHVVDNMKELTAWVNSEYRLSAGKGSWKFVSAGGHNSGDNSV